MKEYLVNILVSKSEGKALSSYRKMSRSKNNLEDLAEIFYDSDDENIEFLGFNVCNLQAIFNEDDDLDEFLGFNICNLKGLFDEDDELDNFPGFDVPPRLEILFNSDDELEEDFPGFRSV